MKGRDKDGPPIEALKAIAHPLRFQILEVLRSGELNVGDLEVASGIGQPALSQQLSVLRKAGLVETRKEAKLVFYSRDEKMLTAVAEAISGQAGPARGDAPRRKAAPGAANFARLS